QHIINDDLDFLQDVGPIFARHAMRTINDLVWGVVLANAGSFFSIGNGNLIDDALTLPGLSAAVAAMRKQRDADGNDLDIVPRVLAVCPELEAEARQLLNSQQVQRDQQADQQPTGNPLQSIAALEVESRLSNTQKFANAS